MSDVAILIDKTVFQWCMLIYGDRWNGSLILLGMIVQYISALTFRSNDHVDTYNYHGYIAGIVFNICVFDCL